MDRRVRCVVMRGGTSKSVLFLAADLPEAPEDRDRVILAAFGSPDPRQIDGLGGADPLTSKLAIVSPSDRDDADVDYLFGQVAITSPRINYQVSCGNTAAAVAVYAVQEGIVPPAPGRTSVRIFCRNSGKIVVGSVPTRSGSVMSDGDYHIDGVPRPGAEIRLAFVEPAGGVTGKLLPSGESVNEIDSGDGRRLIFSLVDCGNLYAIFPADSLSLSGFETPEEIDSRSDLRALLEELRAKIAEQYILRTDPNVDRTAHAAKLKIAVVGNAAAHKLGNGKELEEESLDCVARIVNQERTHKAFAVTGAISFAAAAAIPGSVVNRICPDRNVDKFSVRIGHPQGIIEPVIDVVKSDEGIDIRQVEIGRTARRIMDGFVHVPERME